LFLTITFTQAAAVRHFPDCGGLRTFG